MSRILSRQYEKAVHSALERCQFIEETLRMCIADAIDIAKFQLAPYYPLKWTYADVSKLSMGKLVDIFCRINDDSKLKKSLNCITNERNYVAHQSLLFTIGESQDKNYMNEQIAKIDGIRDRAILVHNTLLDARYDLHEKLMVLELQNSKKKIGNAA